MRIQYTISIKCKINVNQLFILSVKFPINSRLLVIKFRYKYKVFHGFSTAQGLVPLPSTLFKGQLYFIPTCDLPFHFLNSRLKSRSFNFCLSPIHHFSPAVCDLFTILIYPNPRSQRFSLIFYFRNVFLALTFISIVQSKLIFVYSMR